MKRNRPSPGVTGSIEISSSEHGVFIGGDPAGLRSLAGLLNWLAEVDQGMEMMPNGDRVHVHLYAGLDQDRFASLTEGSEDTELCRLDAKGTGELPSGPFRQSARQGAQAMGGLDPRTSGRTPSAVGDEGLCPMNADAIGDLMRQLADGVGQPGVALRCECRNLETVYVAVDEGGALRVTDDHRTFQYLDRGTDSAYLPIESLDLVAAAQVCRELQVELRPAPPDGYPSIECIPEPGEPLSEVVERVAEAIGRVFALAMRPELEC